MTRKSRCNNGDEDSRGSTSKIPPCSGPLTPDLFQTIPWDAVFLFIFVCVIVKRIRESSCLSFCCYLSSSTRKAKKGV